MVLWVTQNMTLLKHTSHVHLHDVLLFDSIFSVIFDVLEI